MTQGLNSSERRILEALAGMALQYLSDQDGDLDHMFMQAGQRAFEVLESYGLIEVHPGNRTANWTEVAKRSWSPANPRIESFIIPR